MDALAYTVEEACRCIGLRRTALYHLIAAGRIDARKAGNRGGRTLILADSLRRYLESLPAADIRTGRKDAA